MPVGKQLADPPGRGPDHRPRRDRQGRLRRHRRPAVLDRAAGLRRPDGLLQGRRTARPTSAKAKQILQDAGIKTPVNITVGWTPTHYGPNTEDEANEVQRQLEASGLFKVTLKSTEWEQYQTIYKQGAYDLWHPRLVPRLPGRRRLPVAVPGRRWLLPERLHEPQGQQARRRGAGHRATRPSGSRSSGSCRTSRPRTSRSSRRGSARTRRLRRGHEGRRGARSTRRSSSGSGWSPRTAERPHSTTVVGRDPSGLSPRRRRRGGPRHDRVLDQDPCRGTSCSASCW